MLSLLTSDIPTQLKRSQKWHEDGLCHDSIPWNIIQSGEAKAVLLGGNSQSFYLLQGTEYQPAFNKGFIMALDSDELAGVYTLHEISRSLESVLQIPGARKNLCGILFGRFKTNSHVKETDLAKIIQAKNLDNIPLVSNLDFGHTTPIATLPIGGSVHIKAISNRVIIEIEV